MSLSTEIAGSIADQEIAIAVAATVGTPVESFLNVRAEPT